MGKKVIKKKISRKKYPEDERKYKWLPMLLDAYYINDIGTQKELKYEIKIRKQKMACKKGCHICCLKPDVPICELEINGISWYVSEKVENPEIRKMLNKQLSESNIHVECPFLVQKSCSIYPVRPLACREFYVFGKPCKFEEDPFIYRPNDIWSSSRKVARKSALKILPFYGITDTEEKIKAYEMGFIASKSKPMHKCDWKILSESMKLFE